MSLLDNIQSELNTNSPQKSNSKVSSKVEKPSYASPLPTELPSSIDDPDLVPKLAPKGRELEEYKVRVAAKNAGVDPHLAAGVALQESGFNPSATSRTGVKGTMQVTQNTASRYGFDRNNPDENIWAGVTTLKNDGLDAYPDPKDLKFWKKNVLANRDKSAADNASSRSSLLDSIKQDLDNPASPSTPQTSPNPSEIAPEEYQASLDNNLAAQGTSLAHGVLEGLGVAPILSKLAENPAAQQASEFVNNDLAGGNNPALLAIPGLGGILNTLLKKDPKSFQQMAEEKAGNVQGAIQANPITNDLGDAGGSVLQALGLGSALGTAAGATGLSGAASQAPKAIQIISKVLGLAGEGAVAGGASALTHGQDPVSGAEIGAIAGPVTAGIGKGLTKAGQVASNLVTGLPLFDDAGKYLSQVIGPTITQNKLVGKLRGISNELGTKLQTVFKNNPEARVNMAQIAQDPDLLSMATKLENATEKAAATKILNKLVQFESRGNIPLNAANELKSTLYDLSKYSTSGQVGKTPLNKFYNSVALKIKDAIEPFDPSIKDINQKLGYLIEAKDALGKSGSMSLTNLVKRSVAGALTGGASELAKATPVGTTLARGSAEAGKFLTKNPAIGAAAAPAIQDILKALGLSGN